MAAFRVSHLNLRRAGARRRQPAGRVGLRGVQPPDEDLRSSSQNLSRTNDAPCTSTATDKNMCASAQLLYWSAATPRLAPATATDKNMCASAQPNYWSVRFCILHKPVLACQLLQSLLGRHTQQRPEAALPASRRQKPC